MLDGRRAINWALGVRCRWSDPRSIVPNAQQRAARGIDFMRARRKLNRTGPGTGARRQREAKAKAKAMTRALTRAMTKAIGLSRSDHLSCLSLVPCLSSLPSGSSALEWTNHRRAPQEKGKCQYKRERRRLGPTGTSTGTSGAVRARSTRRSWGPTVTGWTDLS